MMKKLLQNLVLPFALFSSGILLIGCEQATEPNQQDIQTETSEQNQSASTQNPDKAELKSGNMLYIVRDVADMPISVQRWVSLLNHIQFQQPPRLIRMNPGLTVSLSPVTN